MASEKLTRAIQLIKSGNKQVAIPILKELIQANPRDENAWLWLYACVDQIEQKKVCLQQALDINPGNQDARNALKKLTDLSSPPVQQAAQTNTKRGRRTWLLALLGTGLLLFLCAASFVFLTQTGLASSLAAGLPLFPSATLTPSLTPTFTATATPSPTSTATSTATRRPSATPTLTPSPTPTIPPFTPGNPTATPVGGDIADPNFKKGLAEYKAEHFEEVIRLMSAVIAANPELAPPYRYRGRAYWYVGDCIAGLADSEKAISIDPNYAQGWASRGLMNECLGDRAQALQDYQKALSLDPSLAFVHHNLGVYYAQVGLSEKALEEYELSLAIDPTRGGTWFSLGSELTDLNRYEECIDITNKAIQTGWYAYAGRAACELGDGKYAEAIKDFKVYLGHQPNDSSVSYDMGVAYGHRGDVYYSQGKYTLAIADYKIAVTLIRGDAHSYCNMSYSYFALKQYKNALEAAKSSIAINPECGGQKLLEVAARSAYALHDYDQAIDFMDRALARGSYAFGYYYRGIMLQAAGRKEEALADLKFFLASVSTGKEADDARARVAQLEH